MSSIVRISDGRYVEMDVKCEPKVLEHLQRRSNREHLVTTVNLHVRFTDFATLTDKTEMGYNFFGQSACSPLDTYDREHGIKIAMRRAFDKDQHHTLSSEDRTKIVSGLFPGLIRAKNKARKALEAAR